MSMPLVDSFRKVILSSVKYSVVSIFLFPNWRNEPPAIKFLVVGRWERLNSIIEETFISSRLLFPPWKWRNFFVLLSFPSSLNCYCFQSTILQISKKVSSYITHGGDGIYKNSLDLTLYYAVYYFCMRTK